jgi:hypothetical protein
MAQQTTTSNIVTLAVARRATEFYMSKKKPTFIWGPPGVGKSDMVRQIRDGWAARLKASKVKERVGLIDFRAILRDPVDLRGVPVPDLQRKRTVWLTPDDLPNEERDGKYGVLFLDELNAAGQDVQKACYGLVLDRKLADYFLPDGWVVVAAGNRQQDRSSAQRMPKALANRFAHIEVAANAKVWVEDFAMEHCHEWLVGFMRWRPNLIHVQEMLDKEGKDIADERKFPTPRSWAGVSDVCDAPEDLLYTLAEGLVGQAAAAEFVGFVKAIQDIPDFDDIFNNPMRTKLPAEPSAMWMVSTALAKHSDRDNFDAALKYANRMGREHEIIVAMDATKREPSLTKTKAYVEFTKNNKDISIGNFNVS